VAEYFALRKNHPPTPCSTTCLRRCPSTLREQRRDRALLFVFFERGSSSSKLDSSKAGAPKTSDH